jgi:hypothetical protein
MNRPFQVYLPLELSYQRHVLFAMEFLDAVTLRRLTQGLTVTASGLLQKPIINSSGLFVWLREDVTAFQKITVEPGMQPFENVEIPASQVRMGELSSVELPPRRDYPFVSGITGHCGTLIERRVTPPTPPQPVAGAEVRLMWLDDDGNTWHDAPTRSHTNANGDFTAILRLTSSDVPLLDSSGALTASLRVTRAGQSGRGTPSFVLQQGRVVDKLNGQGSTALPVTLAWNELTL